MFCFWVFSKKKAWNKTFLLVGYLTLLLFLCGWTHRDRDTRLRSITINVCIPLLADRRHMISSDDDRSQPARQVREASRRNRDFLNARKRQGNQPGDVGHCSPTNNRNVGYRHYFLSYKWNGNKYLGRLRMHFPGTHSWSVFNFSSTSTDIIVGCRCYQTIVSRLAQTTTDEIFLLDE